MNNFFRKVAHAISYAVGTSWAFIIAFVVIVVWAVTGPAFGFSDTWQLVVNTTTTILTFLMVFLIQNTQNRDARAIHLKLDELIKAIDPARDSFIDVEDLTDEEIEKLSNEFMRFRKQKMHELRTSRNKNNS